MKITNLKANETVQELKKIEHSEIVTRIRGIVETVCYCMLFGIALFLIIGSGIKTIESAPIGASFIDKVIMILFAFIRNVLLTASIVFVLTKIGVAIRFFRSLFKFK